MENSLQSRALLAVCRQADVCHGIMEGNRRRGHRDPQSQLLKHILENIEIRILGLDYITGRTIPAVISAYTCIERCGDYLTGLWDDVQNISLSMQDDVSAHFVQLSPQIQDDIIFRREYVK